MRLCTTLASTGAKEIKRLLRKSDKMPTAHRRRTDDLISIAQFISGGMLAWGFGYWWEGNPTPAIVAVAVVLLVSVVGWRRRGRNRGLWLTALGLFGLLSKIDPDLSSRALGDFRLLVIVGGSLVALTYGIFIEERERFRAAFSLSSR
jgi:hypothetical protein